MALRDPRLPKEHFEKFLSDWGGANEKRLERLKEGWTGADAYSLHNRITTTLLESTLAAYSMGEAIEDVQARFLRAVDYLPHLHACRDTIPDYVRREYYAYGNKLNWLSLASLFDLDEKRRALVLNQVSFFPQGQDAILERMMTWLGGAELTAGIKEIRWSDMQELWNAINGAPSSRDAHLWTYVNGWYNNNRDAYWHDRHKKKSVTGYFGYWCIEAAAVSVWEGVDDRECRGNEYYPTALADWARLQKQKG